MEEIDIWRAAQQMRKLHGAEAASHATLRGQDMLDQGKTEGFHVWKRIADRIGDLDRQKPGANEPLN